eukprot:TRINITY_DN3148_c0_g2_i7.p1 TRINITY_DN3148_c0_g2~~TRINITY_DN3148_c0_g2_i7.p1  ORF type:complete len:273 (+),score=76.90 TRINITY_DN3148_c0_g2_i7:382-1200(+)
MTVKTTRKTWDPYSILAARDCIRLLARSVPLVHALKVFSDLTFGEIIKIGSFKQNKDRFVRRRQRLIGPRGQTLKAIEMLTDCYVLVQGNTVACVGPHRGIAQVKQIVEDCMNNIHPIYNIKKLMIIRELQKDPEMKGQDWKRFIPEFKKQHIQKKVKKIKKKKSKSVFPPPQLPRKEDLAMESGEYFLSPKQKEEMKRKDKAEKQAQKTQEKKLEREKLLQPPKEVKTKTKTTGSDIEEVVAKIKSAEKKEKKRHAEGNIEDYVVTKKRKH